MWFQTIMLGKHFERIFCSTKYLFPVVTWLLYLHSINALRDIAEGLGNTMEDI
jgi:hypothetical protein